MPKADRDPAPLIGLEEVTVRIAEPGRPGQAILTVPTLSIAAGEMLGIAGPSGAGKTTLLHVLGGLLPPSSGRVRWAGSDIAGLSETARDAWRRTHVGIVFQDFALVPELSVLDNVLLPITFDHWRIPASWRRRAAELAGAMGLPSLSRPARLLSRGEQQRVAIARALLRRPSLLLADEPTASLDADSGHAIVELLVTAARQTGSTLVAVSHDSRLLARLGRVLRLDQGRPVEPAAVLP